MGIETAVAIAAIAASTATVVATVRSMSQDEPEPIAPVDNTPIETATRTAEDKTRQRAMAAAAGNSTILTGSSGITEGGRTILGG